MSFLSTSRAFNSRFTVTRSSTPNVNSNSSFGAVRFTGKVPTKPPSMNRPAGPANNKKSLRLTIFARRYTASANLGTLM